MMKSAATRQEPGSAPAEMASVVNHAFHSEGL
jgi:hypothetical protein